MKKMVYSLALFLGSASAMLAQSATDKVNHAVARNSKVNQMFVTTNAGDVKYYNTAELTSVKFEGNKTIIAPKDGSDNDEYDASVREINFAKRVEQGENGGVENPAGVVKITEAKAWLESAYLKWAPFEGASSYHVYVDGKKIDAQLIRQYASYFRADVLGLKADTYSVKVVPVDAAGKEMAGANTVSNLTVKNYNREGFAHFNFEGIGAYNNDGTLKSDAKVLYITASTAKTVSTEVITGANNKKETVTGLQAIIDAYQKGYDTTPIAFRIIGKVSLADLDGISSSAEGLQIKGKTGYSTMNMTFEGVGDDATIYGFGFLVRSAKSVEFRNFAIMRCLDDAMSLDTENSNIWIHHLDLFYGRKGSAADQAKGDGTVDIKDNSKYVTVAYNHFWDNGKSSMCGMNSETGENWITYHHNWFDHSDSRHARVRTMTVHMYNNYYQHCDVYGVGATMGSSIFMESNYFDAYDVAKVSDQVPASVKTLVGGTSYNNFDTNSSLMYAHTADNAADVPAIIEGFYGAGRLNHGDINFDIPDETVVTNGHQQPLPALASILDSYKSGLLKVFGIGSIAGEGGSTGDNGNTGGSTGGSTGGGTTEPSIPETPDTPSVPSVEGTVLVTFAGKAPSSNIVTVNGSYSTSKDTATIDGTAYTTCVKMESSTSIKLVLDKKVTATFYFADREIASMKIAGTKIKATGSTYTTTLEAGTHEITKDKSVNLFGIKLVPVQK